MTLAGGYLSTVTYQPSVDHDQSKRDTAHGSRNIDNFAGFFSGGSFFFGHEIRIVWDPLHHIDIPPANIIRNPPTSSLPLEGLAAPPFNLPSEKRAAVQDTASLTAAAHWPLSSELGLIGRYPVPITSDFLLFSPVMIVLRVRHIDHYSRYTDTLMLKRARHSYIHVGK